jgi:hypothetical protein
MAAARKKRRTLPRPANGTAGSDDLLAVEIARGSDVVAAAAVAGMSERTAYRRLADPGFKRRVSELRGRMVDQASGLFADGLAGAARTEVKLTKSKDERVRLAAARQIVEHALAIRAHADLSARLAELESQLIGGGDEGTDANAPAGPAPGSAEGPIPDGNADPPGDPAGPGGDLAAGGL